MYHGVLDYAHLRAVIRVALRAHGFTVARADFDHAIEEILYLGHQLRDEGLVAHFPGFFDPIDYQNIAQVDPSLWKRLPRVAGFGWRHATVLHNLAPVSAEVDGIVALLGAVFNIIIALFDYLIDECQLGTLLFEILNRDVLEMLFVPACNLEAIFADASQRVMDPRVRLLLALAVIWGVNIRELYRRSGNNRAWLGLAHLIEELYTSERTVSSMMSTASKEFGDIQANIEAKSVLPSMVMLQVSALASVQLEETWAQLKHIGMTLGRIIWLTDELVDFLGDCDRSAPNVLLVRLAERLVQQNRTWASDADIYDIVSEAANDLVKLLKIESFRSIGSIAHDTVRHARSLHISVEQDSADAALAAILAFARIIVADWVGWQEEAYLEVPLHQLQPQTQSYSSVMAGGALDMLLKQQHDGYQEAIHYMRMPRISPQGVYFEVCPAQLFQRAVVLDGLLDAQAAGYAVPQRILDEETLVILKAKHRYVRGGWSYLAEVPELPPDADDLGMVVQVLFRVGGSALASTCDEAIRLALDAAFLSGGFPTWIPDPRGHSLADEAVQAFMQLIGDGVHPDVVANLLYGLLIYDPMRYRQALLHGTAYLEIVQDETGAWKSQWYAGSYYGTYRAVSVLSAVAPNRPALKWARKYLLQSQYPDGSWGDDGGNPLSTAFAILSLSTTGMQDTTSAIEQGLAYLLKMQEADGGWSAYPWIAFSTPEGAYMYESRTITTTFCLKALLAAHS